MEVFQGEAPSDDWLGLETEETAVRCEPIMFEVQIDGGHCAIKKEPCIIFPAWNDRFERLTNSTRS